MPTIPAFEAEYAACPIWPSNAAIEAVLMITPRSSPSPGVLPVIAAAARRITLNVPVRLILMISSKWSSGNGPFLLTVFVALASPAQLTAVFIDPNFFTAASIDCFTLSSFVTSVFTKSARSPNSAARVVPRSSAVSRIAAAPPAFIISRTTASPNPEAPPVTSAILLLIFTYSSISL